MKCQTIQFKEIYLEPSRNGLNRPTRVRGRGCKMVNMGEIFSIDRIVDHTMERVPMSERDRQSYLLRKHDLLFARSSLKAEGTGKTSIIWGLNEDMTFESHIIRVRLDPIKAHAPYYYYYFKSQIGRANVLSLMNQVSAAGIRASELGLLRVPHLPVSDQRKVAAILSAYDDLLENNTRRIKILEEMAQSIYREWFINFRFPGHEKTRMVASKLGKIPEGWEVDAIGNRIETYGGGTPSTKIPEYWEPAEVTWFIPSDLTKTNATFVFDSEKKISGLGLTKSAAKLFPSYSVMMTSRATIGATAINTIQACTNQGFITCIPNEAVSNYQIYFWIKENLRIIDSIASGATYKEISRSEFRELPIAIADKQVRSIFVDTIHPIFRQIENLLRKNGILRQARDLLLPRLISGELDLSELDISIDIVAEGGS